MADDRGAADLGQPRHDLLGTAVAVRLLGAAADELASVFEDRPLHVRAAEIEPELPHRAVQPPSTGRIVPVTNSAVAR